MLITNQNGYLYEGLDTLLAGGGVAYFATAYVTPGACEQLQLLTRAKSDRLCLAVGRALIEGLAYPTRNYLLRLHQLAMANGGGVRVYPTGFHSKIYAVADSVFVGSSNLTEHGISDWREANILLRGELANGAISEARRLFDGALDIDVVMDQIPHMKTPKAPPPGRGSEVFMPAEPGHPTHGVSINLLARDGELPMSDGLNWGFAVGRLNRSKGTYTPRNRYDCSIPFRVGIRGQGEYVFGSSLKRTHFVAHTHDGQVLNMRLEGGSRGGDPFAKQICTDGDKSVLGKWMIQDCLGIFDGRRVVRADLERYGRTSVQFYRTGTMPDGRAVVYMDFSPLV